MTTPSEIRPFFAGAGTARGRVVLDISTSLGFRLSPANKYMRVERLLAADVVAVGGVGVAILNDGMNFVSADLRDVVARNAHPSLHDRVFGHLLRRVRNSPKNRERVRNLLWQLIFACEGLQPLLRRRSAADSAPLIRRLVAYFARVFEQHDRDLYWKAFDHLMVAAPQFEFRAGDLLILSGATWCHLDLARLEALKKTAGFKVVCCVYDLLPVSHPSFISTDGYRRFRRFLSALSRVADLIVTPSATVGDALRTHLAMIGATLAPPIAPIALTNAALRPGEARVSRRLRHLRLNERRFALCVAPLRKRKHLLWLYALWTELWHCREDAPILICAGQLPEPELLFFLEEDPLWSKAALFLTDPSDEELRWLYRESLFCLHPSFEGGLGLPVREALAYGKPCIVADAASLIEASKGRAIHLPQDRAGWIAMITKLIDRPCSAPLASSGEQGAGLLDQILKRLCDSGHIAQ